MSRTIKILTMIIALISLPAMAQDYVIHVNGIVCEFCSIGVRKKVSKLPFIDRTKYDDGVEVDIENQMVTIAVKSDAVLDKKALFAAIEAAGYNPVKIYELAPDGKKIAYQP
jgi:copper chaperone CopZ